MSKYMTYPNLWKPNQDDFQALMMVRLPAELQQLTQEQYWSLMAERIDWMIRRWMNLAEENQTETHHRLCRTLSQLNSVQSPPNLIDSTGQFQNLETWILEWINTFIQHNDILKQRIWVDFPVEIQPPKLPEAIEQWRLIHDTMNLDEWFQELIYSMVTDEFG